MRFVLPLVFLVSIFATVLCDELEYLDPPLETWRRSFLSVGPRNCVFMAPTGDMLVAVSEAGIVEAYEPLSGSVLWTFSPESISGMTTSSQSGITFAFHADVPYLAYSITYVNASDISW